MIFKSIMRINTPIIKYAIGISALTGALAAFTPTKAYCQNALQNDSFIKTPVPPQGTSDETVLAYAPSNKVKIQGKERDAVIVVDVDNNILYLYNENGKALNAYSVATGKESTPTHKGIRIVTEIETYPYTNAGRWTKRRRTPDAFGPKIIHLNTINPTTGQRGDNGEYIHGNNNPDSIGKKISHGCIRLDNEVAEELAELVNAGDIVLIK